MSLSRPNPNLTFLLDENVDIRVGRALDGIGYTVSFCPKGISDANVLALAKKDGLIVVTNDTDFVHLPPEMVRSLPGIVVLRVHPPGLPQTVYALKAFLHKIGGLIQGKCILLNETGYTMV